MVKPLKTYLILLLTTVLVAACTSSRTVSSTDKNKGKTPAVDYAQNKQDASLYITALSEKVTGNYESAAQMFEAYLKKYPKSADAYYNLAGIYDAQSRSTKALEFSKKACELEKNNKWYLLQKAYLLQRNYNYKETVTTYQELVRVDPRNMDFYFALADAQLRNNQPDAAIETLNKAEKVFGNEFEITYEKYRIFTMTGKYEKAIVELEKLSAQNPGEVRIYGMLGELYEQTGKKEKALEMYEKILKYEPDNGPVHLSLYQYHGKNGDEQKAKAELKKAFESTNVDIDTKMQVLLDYYERSERRPEMKTEAYELLDIVEKVHPADAKTYSIYADFLLRDDKTKEARDKYRKAVELERDKFVIWNQLILLDAQLNDRTALYEDSKQAKELFPTQAGFYFYHGLSCNQLKKYEEGITALNEGKELVIDNDQLLFEFYQALGEAYNYSKKYDESDAAYEKALKLNPENAYALNNYSYYLSLRKVKLEKAAEMSLRSNQIDKNNASFMDTYGWILFQQGKYNDAEVWIKKALEAKGGGNGTLLEHYGDVLYHLNRKTEAIEYWIKAKATGEFSDALEKKIKEGRYVE